MKNFLRALRHALPYRRRIIISITAALFAAVFWGLNFTSIYPVLKLLKTEQSPHHWINDQITQVQKEIDNLEAEIEKKRDTEKDLEKQPNGTPGKEKQLRTVANEL